MHSVPKSEGHFMEPEVLSRMSEAKGNKGCPGPEVRGWLLFVLWEADNERDASLFHTLQQTASSVSLLRPKLG